MLAVILMAACSLEFFPDANAKNNVRDVYVKMALGVNVLSDPEMECDCNGVPLDVDYEDNPIYETGIGATIAPNLRAELELAFSPHNFKQVNTAAVSGDLSSLSLAGNLFYDFKQFHQVDNIIPYLDNKKITPYIGLGAGVSHIKIDDVNPILATSFDDSVSAPFIQGIVGVGFQITDHYSLYTEYKRREVSDIEVRSEDGGTKLNLGYGDNRFMLGLRYSFSGLEVAADKPATQPIDFVPVNPQEEEVFNPPMPETITIFFRFNDSQITQEAARALEMYYSDMQAATNLPIELEVYGHTDRSGSIALNNRLSLQRAMNVSQFFINAGVNEDNVAVYPKGEYEPLKLTKDGVREPKNRRVEVKYVGKEPTAP